MNQQLAITLQSLTVGATEGYWLKLATVELPDDSVTLDEAAEFIDELYSLEACDPPEEDDGGDEPEPDPDEGDLPPPIEEEEFLDLARGLLADSALCAADGDYECQLRVARSHRNFPYKLTFDRGREELRRTVAAEAYQALTVEDSSNVTLDLPVVGSVAAQWDGQVYDQAGPCADPPITVLGSTLNFGKEVTGSLTVRYPTEYDLVTVAVEGLEGETEPQPCHVIAFYHGIVVEHDIEPPERDESIEDDDKEKLCNAGSTVGLPEDTIECYHLVTYKTLCRCSGDVAESHVEEVATDCPESVKNCPGSESECRHLVGSRSEIAGYTSCPEEENLEGTVSDREYYLQVCCEYPPHGYGWLPQCKTVTKTFAGGKKLSEEIKALYPGALFVPVGPGLGICGEATITFQVPGRNCCDGAEPLVWSDEASASVMGKNSTAMVFVTGGYGYSQRDWQVHGQGIFTDPDHTRKSATTDGNYLRLYTDDTACGMFVIEVTDGCSTASGAIRCTAGQWALRCEGLDCECVSLTGADVSYVTDANNTVAIFTSITGKYKVIETVTCFWWVPDGANCGYDWSETWPECACAKYTAGYAALGLTWPPCSPAAEEWIILNSNTACNTALCVGMTPRRCVVCNETGVAYKMTDFTDAAGSHRSTERAIYEWVC